MTGLMSKTRSFDPLASTFQFNRAPFSALVRCQPRWPALLASAELWGRGARGNSALNLLLMAFELFFSFVDGFLELFTCAESDRLGSRYLDSLCRVGVVTSAGPAV